VSIPTFSSYTPPGVYVAPTSTPVVIGSTSSPQVLAICGPALGYRTAVQSFQVYAASGALLTFSGVFTTAQSGPPVIAAPVVVLTGTSTVLAEGTDYTFTVTPDPSGNPALAMTTVFRVSSSSNVSDGQQVTITYNYADATYYQPQVFTNSLAVTAAYGQPLVSAAPNTANATQVANPLSFAAQLAFGAGASQVVLVALNPAAGTLEEQLIMAYAQVSAMYGVTIVVPVFPDYLTSVASPTEVSLYVQALAQDLDAACQSAAANGFPRQGIMGLPVDYSEAELSPGALAAGIDDKRLILAYPETFQVYNSVTRQVFNASGCYAAVVAGAVLSKLPVNTGLTQQVLPGFTGLTSTEVQAMTPAFMNALAAQGVMVIYQNRAGQLVVRQGLTTNMSALNFREISMVRADDALLTALQQGLENSGLIGQPVTPNTVATVQGAITSILQQQVNQSVILGWTNLSVAQVAYPTGDPTIIQASFQYAAFVPLNYITVTYSINLANGLVATQSAQTASSPVATTSQ
jgi:hypothetical protein